MRISYKYLHLILRATDWLASFCSRKVKVILSKGILAGVVLLVGYFTISWMLSLFPESYIIVLRTAISTTILAAMFIPYFGIVIVIIRILNDELYGRIWESTYIVSSMSSSGMLALSGDPSNIRSIIANWQKNTRDFLPYHLLPLWFLVFSTIFISGAILGLNTSTYLAENTSNKNLWTAIFWSIGTVIPILFFFTRYMTNTENNISLLYYFPYLFTAILSYTISVSLAVLILMIVGYSNSLVPLDPLVPFIGMSLWFTLIAYSFQFLVLLRILHISMTSRIVSIKERAAKRVIHQKNLKDLKLVTSQLLLTELTTHSHSRNHETIEITGSDFGFTEDYSISDINFVKLYHIVRDTNGVINRLYI